MRPLNKIKLLKLFTIYSVLSVGIYSLVGFSSSEPKKADPQNQIKEKTEQRSEISKALGEKVRANLLPQRAQASLKGTTHSLVLNYTINQELQKEADRLLKSYKPDYGAIFMMNAETGEVIAMSSFQRDNPQAPNLNLQATFPAASLFKVVTATAAVDKAGISPEHIIRYNGGAHTLYKKNVLSEKVTRWTNNITLRDAFARSINTAFGRLSIENLHPTDLSDYASRFLFNHFIPADFPVESGIAEIPLDKGFQMAEAASGFNKTNRMSPVQGAIIAGSIANDGQIVVPYLYSSILNESGEKLYEGRPLTNGLAMTKDSAAKVRELMEQTIISGTSRRSFRPMIKDRKYKEIEVGGKTGHLTGDNPRGRVDWFIGYALDQEEKISVAAITVNKKFWTVKSSFLGQSMIKKYFAPLISSKKKEQTVTSSK